MEKRRNRKKYIGFSLFVVVIILGLLVLIPKTINIHETFKAYPLETRDGAKNFQLDIEITGSRLPFFSKKHDVTLSIDGRNYQYLHANYPDRKETYIPLSIGVFKFGVILPNDDFSEFIILFDEAHHFGENKKSYYAAYPQRDEEATKLLLRSLIEKNQFDLKNKSIE